MTITLIEKHEARFAYSGGRVVPYCSCARWQGVPHRSQEDAVDEHLYLHKKQFAVR